MPGLLWNVCASSGTMTTLFSHDFSYSLVCKSTHQLTDAESLNPTCILPKWNRLYYFWRSSLIFDGSKYDNIVIPTWNQKPKKPQVNSDNKRTGESLFPERIPVYWDLHPSRSTDIRCSTCKRIAGVSVNMIYCKTIHKALDTHTEVDPARWAKGNRSE